MNVRNLCKLLFLSVAAAAMAACAPATVKEINANRSGYVEANFSQKQIPEGVARALNKNGTPVLNFKTARIKMNAVYASRTSKEQTPTVTLALRNLGDGYILRLEEYESNGIAYGSQYSISHGGVLKLRDQDIFYSRAYAGQLFEVKELTAYPGDVSNPGEHSTYLYEWQEGAHHQIANFTSMKMICSTGKFYEASSLFSELKGKAIDFNCERLVDGITRAKQKFALLMEFGIVILLEYQSAVNKNTHTIVGVEIQ